MPSAPGFIAISARWLALAVSVVIGVTQLSAATPVLNENVARPLRYHPDGTDFVIENGPEFFNRPLYCLNSAFRIDAGDKPEFSLYIPGRGGNLRLGIKTPAGAKWLSSADKIVARYRAGSMLYEITDPLLSQGTLHLTALPMSSVQGLVLRAELSGTTTPVELVWAYGGASGDRGQRAGDIGCEREPVSQFFQLKPEYCRGSTFSIEGSTFTSRSKPATIAGITPTGSVLAIADAANWSDLGALLTSAGKETSLPVMVGHVALPPGQPLHLALQRISESANTSPFAKLEDLPQVFVDAELHRESLAERIVVDTPDPFINAAAAAICVAADGIWDDSTKTFMHGAVAWRTKLPGWRGPYSGDALGWHDRTRSHLDYWTARQNTQPIPDTMPPADPSVNLTRNEAALHSNGDIANSHYDMNLVVIDALFRHLLWTGDLAYARKMWPVIQRHLAWEKRLFRRPFGPDKLPLYEAYCCIWASDNMQYDGAGVTHSTAYNHFHNHMAARVAKLLGEDPAPYEREAGLILKAMHEELWLPDRGWFAESRDYLGLQQPHPSPGLWTFYHTMDSQVPSPLEAWQMTRFVDTQIAHIPIKGPGVPDEGCFTLPTSNWMPYMWSLNNVVVAEVAHTSLAYWQAGRYDEAFKLFKGCMLDTMYLGLCPGNVGMATHFDVARGESQRDFGDGIGMSSRALVEGLFGIHPDVLVGELFIQPGLPAKWDHASIEHPDLIFRFKRDGLSDSYSILPKFAKPVSLRLRITAQRDSIASLALNGKPVQWRVVDDFLGEPRIEITTSPAPRFDVTIKWRGTLPAIAMPPPIMAMNVPFQISTGIANLLEIADPEKFLVNVTTTSNSFHATTTGLAGHHTAFAKLQQGGLTWWQPLSCEIRPPYELGQTETQNESSLRFRLQNNTTEKIDQDVTIRASGRYLKRHLTIFPFAESEDLSLPSDGILPLPGSDAISVELDASHSFVGSVTNWKIQANAIARFQSVDLTSSFNDQVTRIFQHDYLFPRSPFCSLQTPRQGIGGWCDYHTLFNVDDSGLREQANRNGGRFIMPQGIPFQTPVAPDAKNIAFVSQWDNFPRQINVPLTGTASHVYLLMAGSSGPMQSRCKNGEVVVTYSDGSTENLSLTNPDNWWPIDQDYFIDDFAFARPGSIPPRVDLRTGNVQTPELPSFHGNGGIIRGGAATVLDLPLRNDRQLKSLTVSAVANEVVIGLMAVTLVRN